MSREQLAAEALAAGQAARHNLKWMDKHPDRIDQSKRKEMKEYLNSMIRFSKMEIKNTRSAKRASLRNRLKFLVVFIIPHLTEKQHMRGLEK